MISLHCQICARRFEPESYERRFCSQACCGIFGRLRPRNILLGRTQIIIMGLLRAQPGAWIARSTIARALYGDASVDEQRATYAAIWRLRHVWAPRGLVIDVRDERRRFEREGEMYYRLSRDLPEDAAVAS